MPFSFIEELFCVYYSAKILYSGKYKFLHIKDLLIQTQALVVRKLPLPLRTPADDSCRDHLCQNEGTCVAAAGGVDNYSCSCLHPYRGRYCEEGPDIAMMYQSISPCSHHDCQHGHCQVCAGAGRTGTFWGNRLYSPLSGLRRRREEREAFGISSLLHHFSLLEEGNVDGYVLNRWRHIFMSCSICHVAWSAYNIHVYRKWRVNLGTRAAVTRATQVRVSLTSFTTLCTVTVNSLSQKGTILRKGIVWRAF